MTVSDAESDTFSEKSEFQIRLGFGFGSGLPYCPELKHQLLHWSCLVAD